MEIGTCKEGILKVIWQMSANIIFSVEKNKNSYQLSVGAER